MEDQLVCSLGHLGFWSLSQPYAYDDEQMGWVLDVFSGFSRDMET